MKTKHTYLNVQKIGYWQMLTSNRTCVGERFFTAFHRSALRNISYWSFYVDLRNEEIGGKIDLINYFKYQFLKIDGIEWQITRADHNGFVLENTVYDAHMLVKSTDRIWSQEGRIQIVDSKDENDKTIIVGALLHIKKPSIATQIGDAVVKIFSR